MPQTAPASGGVLREKKRYLTSCAGRGRYYTKVMPTYTATVIETRNVAVKYTVEADSYEEAVEKLENGETEDEEEGETLGVVSRMIDSEVTPS